MATDYRLDPNAVEAGDGSTWEKSFRSWADAAAVWGTGDRVFVKAGVFRETTHITVPASVKIFGGFSPYLTGNSAL